MSTVTGRHTEARTVAGVGTTNTSTALTGSAGTFNKADVGRPVSGTGIPAGATIAAVASGTAATLSANATATGTISLTFGRNIGTDSGYGFFGWSPETEAEASVYGVTGSQASPDRLADSKTRVDLRNR
jgi:hypothetical protein